MESESQMSDLLTSSELLYILDSQNGGDPSDIIDLDFFYHPVEDDGVTDAELVKCAQDVEAAYLPDNVIRELQEEDEFVSGDYSVECQHLKIANRCVIS